MRRDLRGVASAAFAVALQAKCNRLDAHAVRQLAVQAECLPDTNALRTGISRFAQDFHRHRRQPDQLVTIGDQLAACVTDALRPVPTDLDRKDIHG